MNRFALPLLIFAGCSGGTGAVPPAAPVATVNFFERAQDRIVAGDLDGAMGDLNEVLAKEPDHAGALLVRGSLFITQSEHTKAVADLERAVVLNPTSPHAANDLAWLLATSQDDSIRDGKRAVQFARIALIRGKDAWQHLDTYAAALAESGDFQAATTSLTALLQYAPEENKAELQKRLEAYKAGKPWRE